MNAPLTSRKTRLIVVSALAAATSFTRGQQDSRPVVTTQPTGAVLKLITYNVQFLPGWASLKNERKHPEYRARRLGDVLSGYDLVGLNEVFHLTHRKILLDRMKRNFGERYHVVISPKSPGHRFNGGLAIVSRLPFLETHAMVYTHFSSPADYGLRADGFAAKGALHARVLGAADADRSDFFDVFITHMEARDDEVRLVQFEEFSDFVWMHADPDHPVVLMGDFNTNGRPELRREPTSRYNRLLFALRRARPALIDLWPTLHPDAPGCTTEQETTRRGKRIDYVFVSNPPRAAARLTALAVRVNGFLDRHVVALSDHSAVEADLVWERR